MNKLTNNKFLRKITKFAPASALRLIQNVKAKSSREVIVQNINIDPCISKQKSVLIAYVTSSLMGDTLSWDTNTRPKECAIIIKTFIDKGFVVDVIGCNDQQNLSAVINKQYDVLFGFGIVFYELCKRLPNARKILYLTERHPDFSHKKEKERIDYFYERHHKKIPFERSGLYYKKEHFEKADVIVYVGRESDREFLPAKTPCYPISVTGLLNNEFDISSRKITTAKKNYLWLGSRGAIHKGLDLLVDVFDKQNDCVLHIAGLNSVDRKLLPNYTNRKCIVDHGFLNIQSVEFRKLMEQCAFIIFPSCSEGISTSVITAMNHGLIPIVTPESGIEISGIGRYIHDYTLKSLEQIIQEFSAKSDEWLNEQQYATLKYASENYNITQFGIRLKELINDFQI